VAIGAVRLRLKMRILFALAGFHRYNRGAETAFIALANELAKSGDKVTLIGSGPARAGTSYQFVHAASLARDNFTWLPSIPALRDDCAYEELTFIPGLMRAYRPANFDVTLTCSYPFTNWLLRRRTSRNSRPRHVFVTENGDWPAFSRKSEYRWFGCDGLVCTNPDFFERNKDRWRCRLIPNGIDCARFQPGPSERQSFGLPQDSPIVLMVSALVPSKRVELGVEAVGRIPGAHLVVAGDGPLREAIESKAAQLLAGRFSRLSVAPERMPALYRSADVFLHLSKEESFGNVFLEAMACGLPIVAGNSPRVRWIVGDREFLFDTDAPQEIASRLEAARKAPAHMRDDRVKRADGFAWGKIARSYREFLSDVIASNGQHRISP
jgi:glycosyltransferase involved in cell wall biosynthesis